MLYPLSSLWTVLSSKYHPTGLEPHKLIRFSWRVLLSLVQKSHFKSNNIPRILAAVDVYQALVEKPTTRADTLKKLASMLNTNPYPTVRESYSADLSHLLIS